LYSFLRCPIFFFTYSSTHSIPLSHLFSSPPIFTICLFLPDDDDDLDIKKLSVEAEILFNKNDFKTEYKKDERKDKLTRAKSCANLDSFHIIKVIGKGMKMYCYNMIHDRMLGITVECNGT
jgi:hypothetical protein